MAKTSITAKLGLDTTAFQRGLAKSQKSIGNFVKSGIAKFGALAGAAGLGSMARAAIDLGSKISDMAVQLNIGTTELQVLDFAAREAGVGTDIMARALRNVQLRTEEAIKGNKSYSQAFEQLGIDIEAFKKLNTEQKMEAIAKAQANATDKAAAYNATARILGEKAGPALQEVLQNLAGPEGYGGLEAAAERAGEVMSEDTIAKMDKAADKIESFKRRMTVLTAEVLTKVVPAFSILGQGLGFVGDILGIVAANMLAFGRAVGTVLKAVVAPAISQMEALGLAIKAAGQFMDKDFSGAKKSINAAKKAAGEMVDEVKAIPGEINGAFDQLKRDGAASVEVLGDSVDNRAKKIEQNLKDIKSAATEATDEIKKVDKATGGGTSGVGAAAGGGVSRGGVIAPMSTTAKSPERRRKFGESLTRYDPTTGEERKLGESFSRSDSVNRQQRLKDVMAQLEAKNKSADKTNDVGKATIESSKHLEIIKDELTRKGN